MTEMTTYVYLNVSIPTKDWLHFKELARSQEKNQTEFLTDALKEHLHDPTLYQSRKRLSKKGIPLSEQPSPRMVTLKMTDPEWETVTTNCRNSHIAPSVFASNLMQRVVNEPLDSQGNPL